MRADTQSRILKHLINKMFEYANVPQTYDDIKDRKGYLNEQGVFVKEGDEV